LQAGNGPVKMIRLVVAVANRLILAGPSAECLSISQNKKNQNPMKEKKVPISCHALNRLFQKHSLSGCVYDSLLAITVIA